MKKEYKKNMIHKISKIILLIVLSGCFLWMGWGVVKLGPLLKEEELRNLCQKELIEESMEAYQCGMLFGAAELRANKLGMTKEEAFSSIHQDLLVENSKIVFLPPFVVLIVAFTIYGIIFAWTKRKEK